MAEVSYSRENVALISELSRTGVVMGFHITPNVRPASGDKTGDEAVIEFSSVRKRTVVRCDELKFAQELIDFIYHANFKEAGLQKAADRDCERCFKLLEDEQDCTEALVDMANLSHIAATRAHMQVQVETKEHAHCTAKCLMISLKALKSNDYFYAPPDRLHLMAEIFRVICDQDDFKPTKTD